MLGAPTSGSGSGGGGGVIPPTDACLNKIALEYGYEDIKAATDTFSRANQLGKGTYGSVYKGVLRDGTEV